MDRTGTLELRTAVELRDAVLGALPDAPRRWAEALAAPEGPAAAPLLSLLDDWSGHAELEYREMLAAIFDAKERVDLEWEERRPEGDDAVARFYDETSTSTPLLLWWHGTEPGPARTATAAAAVFAAVGARDVLDFGAGIGSTALVLAASGLTVTIADVSRPCLALAAHRFERRGYDANVVDLLESGLEALPAASFDGVVSFDVFEHLPDARPAASEIDRLLRPGGVLVFNQAYVPDEDEPQHFPQRGEVLEQLAALGYVLAHVPDVCWVAQKADLPTRRRARQRLDVRVRVAAVAAAERGAGRFAQRLGRSVIRRSLG